MKTLMLIAAALVGSASGGQAQMLADTTFSWRGFTTESVCRVRVYRSAAGTGRPVTILLDEVSANQGRSSLDDAPHLVELLSRALQVKPDSAFWIFHWGAFSFSGAAPSGRELFFRATFTRSDSGSLGTPFWRLVDRETVIDYTDRAYW